MSKLITKSAQKLKAKGFRQLSSHVDRHETGRNVNYTMFEFRGEVFLVRAKEYVYRGRAPFGRKMVDRAIATDALLVGYFDDVEQFYVFDPSHVFNTGELTTGNSKHSASREWLEVPLTDGTLLSEYTAGKSALTGRAETVDSERTSLDEWL